MTALLTWRARFFMLVAILFLRTADVLRAIERHVHAATHWGFGWVVGVGLKPEIARYIYNVDTLTRGVCAPATILAYRWCNWWRHRGWLVPEAEASNEKGTGAWVKTQKQQR